MGSLTPSSEWRNYEKHLPSDCELIGTLGETSSDCLQNVQHLCFASNLSMLSIKALPSGWLIRGCTHGFSLLPGPSDCRLQDVALQTIHQKLAAEIGEVTDVSVDVAARYEDQLGLWSEWEASN